MRAATLLVTLLALPLVGCEKDDEPGAEAEQPAADKAGPPVAAMPDGKMPAAAALGMMLGKKSAERADTAPQHGLFSGRFNKVGGILGGKADPAASAGGQAGATTPATPPAAPPATKQPGPTGSTDCASVAKHVVGLMKAEMADTPTNAVAEVEKELTRRCTSDNWSAAARQCVLTATSVDALEACEAKMPYRGSGGTVASPPGGTVASPPGGTGTKMAQASDAKCKRLADHLVKLSVDQLPQAQRAQVAPHMDQMRTQLHQQCGLGWPEVMVDCMLASKSTMDMQGCASKMMQ